MLASSRAMRLALTGVALAAMLIGPPTVSHAASGSIRITITRTQFVFGSGNVTLHFRGERYPLRVGGVSAGPFGAARVDLVGRAYNLQSVANIHGVYSTVVADPSKKGRAGIFRLRNWQGVVLELRGRRGVKPSVDLNGLQISLR